MYLKDRGIETAIHYQFQFICSQLQIYLGYKKGDFKFTEDQSKRILSLPIHQNLTKKDIHKIIYEINRYIS